jgi:excisionase family DNA binding protein
MTLHPLLGGVRAIARARRPRGAPASVSAAPPPTCATAEATLGHDDAARVEAPTDPDRTIQAGNATSSSSDDHHAEVMNADEVAAFLRVDRKTVYDYAARGELPFRRLGRRLLFSRSALVAWLGACKVASRAHGA